MRRIYYYVLLLGLVFLSIAGCTSGAEDLTAQRTQVAGTMQAGQGATAEGQTPPPSSTTAPAAPSTPMETRTPDSQLTATPAATPTGPDAGKPLPTLAVLAPSNLDQLEVAATWGGRSVFKDQLFTFSHDGNILAAAASSQVILYDTANWEPYQTYEMPGEVYTLVFDRDDARLAVGHHKPPTYQVANEKFTGVTILEMDTGAVLEELEVNDIGRVVELGSMAFSPDGSQLIAAENESSRKSQALYQWELDESEDLPMMSSVNGDSILLSPGGSYLAARLGTGIPGAVPTVEVYDRLRGNRVLELPFSWAFGFTQDEAWFVIATGYDPVNIEIWSLAEGAMVKALEIEHLTPGEWRSVTSLDIPAGETRVVYHLDDGALWAWDWVSGDQRQLVGSVEAAGLKAAPGGGAITVRDPYGGLLHLEAEGTSTAVLLPFLGNILDANFNQEGDFIALYHTTLAAYSAQGGTISRYQAMPTAQYGILAPGGGFALTIQNAGSDRVAVYAAASGEMTWDVQTSLTSKFANPYGNFLTDFALAPGGSAMIIGRDDGVLGFWDRERDAVLLPEPYQVDGILAAFSPKGDRLYAGTSEGVLLSWRVHDLAQLPTRRLGDQPVQALAFSPDGTLAAAGMGGGAVIVWRAVPAEASPEQLTQEVRSTLYELTLPLRGAQIPYVEIAALAFSPDSRLLAVLGTGGTWLWDMETGELLARFEFRETWIDDRITFSPDGTMLIVSRVDGTITVLGTRKD